MQTILLPRVSTTETSLPLLTFHRINSITKQNVHFRIRTCAIALWRISRRTRQTTDQLYQKIGPSAASSPPSLDVRLPCLTVSMPTAIPTLSLTASDSRVAILILATN